MFLLVSTLYIGSDFTVDGDTDINGDLTLDGSISLRPLVKQDLEVAVQMFLE